MRLPSVLPAALAALVALATVAATPAPGGDDTTAPSPVVAIVGEAGINVVHDDFRVSDPAPLPASITDVITLPYPGGATFEQRVAELPELSALQRDQLYRLDGTNLLVIAPTIGTRDAPIDVFANHDHGTWVAASLMGRSTGTAPHETLAVMVLGIGAEPWEWVADQPWIGVASTSAGELFIDCPANEAEPIRRYRDQGGVVFAANGNYDLGATTYVTTPLSLPGVYQVGAVDDLGRPVQPGSEPTPLDEPHGNLPTARLYETGDRYRVLAPASGSTDAYEVVHGTSFGTPSTAGRATELVQLARQLLDDTDGLRGGGSLGRRGDAPTPIATGPLADGELTGTELTDLLHATAIPWQSAPPAAARYLLEGYGALNTGAIEHARAVLAGEAPLPSRPGDDAAHELADIARAGVYQPQLCS